MPMAWYTKTDGSYDPRHEMVQIIADEVKKANVDLDIKLKLNHFINQKNKYTGQFNL